MNPRLKYPMMQLSPDYGFPSGRILRKTLGQIAEEYRYRRQLIHAIAGALVLIGSALIILIG